MVFWKKIFNFFGTTCNGFRLSCRVVKEGNEGKCGANAQGEKGETRRGERRASSQAGGGPPSLPFSPLSVCVLPVCPSSRCTRCSERATSLARSTHYGSPPYVWGEMHCWYGSRPVPRGKSNARISRLSFVLLFTCGQCIAMNSCECSTTNTHSPSFRWDSFPIRAASSLFDAKPLYTPIFGLLIVFTYSH